MEWTFADAEKRLNEVVDRALTEGVQWIRRGEEIVVVIAAAEYDRVVIEPLEFKDYLASGESFEGLDLARGETCLDLARRLGILGHAQGLPPDLSINQKNFDGFGSDWPDV
jgi:prevent-host-death family protein